MTNIHTRVVTKAATIIFEKVEFCGKTEYDKQILQSLIGKRVFIQYANYWQTELHAAGHKFVPGCNTIKLKFTE
jgi:hypothetical protein